MNVHDIRNVVTDYINNTANLRDFNERNDYNCNLYLIVNGILDDITIENNFTYLTHMLLRRVDQLVSESLNFNRIVMGNPHLADPHNLWSPVYSSTVNLIRVLRALIGIMLIEMSAVNITNQQINDIINQLGIADIIDRNNMN